MAVTERHGPTGRLTTHVLDTMRGQPAADIAVVLYRLQGAERILLATTRTNADGRCDQPLLTGADCTPGLYELVFHVGAYFRAQGVSATIPFLDVVPIRFGIASDAAHYHVPLLISPFAYSTYRGS
ncbi:MAG: hydroxyisourate hydrolase [Azospirillaceae bacterium]|nr:hydroxyisourate hydrolase [Azospirillaceae bacterium]